MKFKKCENAACICTSNGKIKVKWKFDGLAQKRHNQDR